MSYAIQPNSNVYLCAGVPLDNTYRNTLTFNSLTDQANYFISKKVYAYTEQQYLRLENNKMRINSYADYLLNNVNYMMFQNCTKTGTGGYINPKWIYCFITGIQYINDEVTEITYEIDVMQTWKFDFTVNPSFVEREHVNDDSIGAHLIPENLETGDYISDAPITLLSKLGNGFSTMAIVVAATFDKTLAAKTGSLYGNVYSGLVLNIFNQSDHQIQDVNNFINLAVSNSKADGIVSIYMVPDVFALDVPGDEKNLAFYQTALSKPYSNIDGYIPKNNKLFCYPYQYLYATGNSGSSAEFHYEYFQGDLCNFDCSGTDLPNPQVMVVPRDYKLKSNVPNPNEKIVVDGFPQCSYNTDTYKAWLAQNAGSMAIAGMSAVGEAGANAAMLNVGGAVSNVTAIAQQMNSIFVHSMLPPQAHGATGDAIAFANNIKDVIFYPTHIRAEFAKTIDDYFSMYGYKVNSVKVPNITGRQNWNFVKTINVSITGNIPANALAKIRGIYDNGVTFWHNPANVGNYLLSNSIV